MLSYVFDEDDKDEDNQGISLSLLLNRLKTTIDKNFRSAVWVKAEISNVKKQGMLGHYYFEITERDAKGKQVAKINANCWKGTAINVIPELERQIEKPISSGIICYFLVNVIYSEIYGLSLNILQIKPAWTIGEHEKKKQKIKEKIEKLGIGNKQKELSSPKIITSIALIAPAKAAGLGDFMSEANKWSNTGAIKIKQYSSIFEGENAKESISSSFKDLKNDNDIHRQETGRNLYDLVIILRGGGAKSSLAFLDEEDILKGMLSLDVPVWSAIGHEEDSVLLDEYACLSFHTPSKSSAEIWRLIKNESDFFDKKFNEIFYFVDLKTQQAINNIESQEEKVKIHSRNKLNQLLLELDHKIEKIKLLDPMNILEQGFVVLFDEKDKIIKEESKLLKTETIKIKTSFGTFEMNINNIKKLEK